MRELRLSDAELQALIAPALRKKLKAAGFAFGTATDEHAGFYFPINLALAGSISVVRYEDGTWVFAQETNATLADRTADAFVSHVEACTRVDVAFKTGNL